MELQSIQESATAITAAPLAYLTGDLLIARLVYHCLRPGRDNAIRAGDISRRLHGWGHPIEARAVRGILRALAAGGLPIRSATSHGYWLE